MMSNSNQKQVKLKASIEDLVEPLLKRLSVVNGPKEEIVKNMSMLIEESKDYLESRQIWDNELMRIYGDIEKQIEYCQKIKGAHKEGTSSIEEENSERIWTGLMENIKELLHQTEVYWSMFRATAQKRYPTFSGEFDELSKIDDLMDNSIKEMRDYLEKFKKSREKSRVSLSSISTTAQQEESFFLEKTTTYEVGGPSNTNDQVDDAKKELRECRNKLKARQMIWLDSLGIFPLYTKLNKRLLIHWWIGLGQEPSKGNINTTKLLLMQQCRMHLKSILRYMQQRRRLNVSQGDIAISATREKWAFSQKNKKEQADGGALYHESEDEHPNQTMEQLAENFFNNLVNEGILEPIRRKHNQVIKQCSIKPKIHRHLRATFWLTYKTAQREDVNRHVIFDYCKDARALLNVDQKYLKSENIASKNVLGDNNTLQVVHFGQWHCTDMEIDNRDEEVVSFETKSEDHIEVDGIDFLTKLGENVVFLSLRGISMIEKLPESIGKMKNLRILDLRACHNLANLPHKPQSKALRLKSRQENWFDNLTHLDISECYLLNHMPKWICELSNLEVFKGYIAGSEGKKNQLCQLHDLSKLKKLRKLSIRIVKPLDPEEARGLESLNWLSILTVSWSINKPNDDKDIVWPISFPVNLEKLDIRCYPEADTAKLLNPADLLELKRLYIRGGNIAKIANGSFGTVEILRVRFLKFLEIKWYELNRLFPKLKHVEYKCSPKLKDFPNKGSWNAEKDGPFTECQEATQVEMNITSNTMVPLEGNVQTIMLELTGRDYSITDKPRLNLVVVLDVSKIYLVICEDKIKNLKSTLLFVINKLSSDDRLAIVTFSDEVKTIWPLKQIESSRKELENLVTGLSTSANKKNHIIFENKIKNQKSTLLFDGLSMGLDILKDPKISSQYRSGIILISCAPSEYYHSNDVPDISDVAVHTFGLGTHYNEKVLESIASKSRGGTYSEVQNSENLIKAVSVCLAGLLTVVVQDLTLILKPIKGLSIVDEVCAGSYLQLKQYDVGSVTIKFGDLYRGEVRKVLVDLDLPAVDEEGDAEVLKVAYSYKLSRNSFMDSRHVVISVCRNRTVSADQLHLPDQVLAEQTRLQTVHMIGLSIENINEFTIKHRLENMLLKMNRHESLSAELDELHRLVKMKDRYSFMSAPFSQTVSADQLHRPEVLAEETRLEKLHSVDSFLKERKNRHGTNESLESLSAELDELLKLTGATGSSRYLVSKFGYSFESSHNRQRAAGRGADMEKCLSFATPAMLSFLREADEFYANHKSLPIPIDRKA